MERPVWIGVDIGTTGVRAVAYEADGRSQGSASREYRLLTPKPGWAEQEPAEIVSAIEDALRELVSVLAQANRRPDGLALSSVFHSFVALDRQMRPASQPDDLGGPAQPATPARDEAARSGILAGLSARRLPGSSDVSLCQDRMAAEATSRIRRELNPVRLHQGLRLHAADRRMGGGPLDRQRLRTLQPVEAGVGPGACSTSWESRKTLCLRVVPTTYSRALSKEAAQRTGLAAGNTGGHRRRRRRAGECRHRGGAARVYERHHRNQRRGAHALRSSAEPTKKAGPGVTTSPTRSGFWEAPSTMAASSCAGCATTSARRSASRQRNSV